MNWVTVDLADLGWVAVKLETLGWVVVQFADLVEVAENLEHLFYCQLQEVSPMFQDNFESFMIMLYVHYKMCYEQHQKGDVISIAVRYL